MWEVAEAAAQKERGGLKVKWNFCVGEGCKELGEIDSIQLSAGMHLIGRGNEWEGPGGRAAGRRGGEGLI